MCVEFFVEFFYNIILLVIQHYSTCACVMLVGVPRTREVQLLQANNNETAMMKKDRDAG